MPIEDQPPIKTIDELELRVGEKILPFLTAALAAKVAASRSDEERAALINALLSASQIIKDLAVFFHGRSREREEAENRL